MNSEWIKALSQLEADATPAVMITVVDERGSTPRNAGAKMLVRFFILIQPQKN